MGLHASWKRVGIGMQSLRLAVVIPALLLFWAAPARAGGFLTPFVGYNFGGDSSYYCVSLAQCDEKRLNWGLSIGTTHGIFGFEEDISYAPNFFGSTPGGDNGVLTVMSNLLIIVPAGPVQPYANIGLGLIRPHVTTLNPSVLTSGKNALGYNIGAGLNIFLGRHVGVRGDVRHLQTLQNVTLALFSGEKIDFWRASAGLTLRF
jgi:hypothetical protein